MADTVAFDLVSPEQLLLSEAVEMVVLPGVEGDIGVLPGHAPVITQIRPGTICVFEGGQVKKRLFVEGGFAEVMPDRCTVLAEQAHALDDVEIGAVEQEIRDLKDDMAIAETDFEKAAKVEAIVIAEAKLDAKRNPTYA